MVFSPETNWLMKSGTTIFIVFALLVAVSVVHRSTPLTDTLVISHTYSQADSLALRIDSLLRKSVPVMGYRFVVKGDFDGDGVEDVLQERFTDSLYDNEVAKFYESNDSTFGYEDLAFINNYFYNKSFMFWGKYNLKLSGGSLGFHYVENCGDINNDGKDEVLVVRQWDDYSNINTAVVYTLINSTWQQIYSTGVWEWQFPPTPAATMAPGPFGSFNILFTNNSEADTALEKQLKAFTYMCYYPDGSVEFSGRNEIDIIHSDVIKREFEELDEQSFLKRYFSKVRLNDSLYLKRKDNPAIYYKTHEFLRSANDTVIMFPLDDSGDMLTTRIFTRHKSSPFKIKGKR